MAGSRGKRITGTVLFVVALLAVGAFVLVLFADSEGIDSVPGTDRTDQLAILMVIILSVLALILFLTLVIRKWERQDEEAEEAEMFFVPDEYRTPEPEPEQGGEVDPHADSIPVESMGGGLVPYDLRSIPARLDSWGHRFRDNDRNVHPYHFPRYASRAVYANDYIPVDDRTAIKLSTLIAAPPGMFHGSFAEEAPSAPRAPARPEASPPEEPWTPEETPPALLPPTNKEEEEAEAPETAPPAVLENPPAPEPTGDAHYDYKGDVHEVIDVEGIGPIYAEKLQQIGVRTTDRLCYEDAGTLAGRLEVPERTVLIWQHMSELMKVSGIGKQYAEALARAGVEGIGELKRRSPAAIADQVNAYLDNLETNVLGQHITARRIEGWQKKAKPMRRVRRPVPES